MERLMLLNVAVSVVLAAMSCTVWRITSVSAGHTMIWPVRLTTMLKADGYTCTLPTSSVSQSKETSAVNTAATRPFLSCTGME